MRFRIFAAGTLAVTLALAAASVTGARTASPAKHQANAITVWLMSDAQSNWPEAVAAANQAFKQAHPGVDVQVQYQGWGDYKTKFEATLASGNGPDVLEFGNTDVPKYSSAGALAALNRADFPNSSTWLSDALSWFEAQAMPAAAISGVMFSSVPILGSAPWASNRCMTSTSADLAARRNAVAPARCRRYLAPDHRGSSMLIRPLTSAP